MNIPSLKKGYYCLFLEALTRKIGIGVYPEETIPQPVKINVMTIVSRLSDGDGIEDVIDYNHLRDTVTKLTDERHFGLQETFCEAIISELMTHDGVHGVIVETRKTALFEDCDAMGCRMSRIDDGVLAG